MFLILWLFFMVLSGKWTLELVLFGLGIAAVVLAFMCAFMDWSLKKELSLMPRLPKLILYGLKLFWEIVKANLVMLRRIYSRKAVEPAIVTVHTDLKDEKRRVMLANAITLTPGTITVYTHDNRFTVHALTGEMLDGMEDSSFVRLLKKLEG